MPFCINCKGFGQQKIGFRHLINLFLGKYGTIRYLSVDFRTVKQASVLIFCIIQPLSIYKI